MRTSRGKERTQALCLLCGRKSSKQSWPSILLGPKVNQSKPLIMLSSSSNQLCCEGLPADANSKELDRLRLSLQRANQDNEGLNNKLSLLDSVHSECPSREKELLDRELELKTPQLTIVEEKIKGLEHEKLALSAEEAKAEADLRKLVQEFISTVVRRLHTSVEYRQSLAAPVSLCFTVGWLGGLSLGRNEDQIAQILSKSEDLDIEGSKSWEAKHRDLFTMYYPYIQKVADSCDLPINELLKVSPDVPSSADKGDTSSVVAEEAP
ncbi:hypothetical protein Tco_0290078 [Tanacetum coccineum]